MVGLILTRLTVELVGLAVRLLSALLLFLLWLLLPLAARVLFFLILCLVVSLTAIPAPWRSAGEIADRIVDRMLQLGFRPITNPAIYRFLRVLVLAGFAAGWVLVIFIGIEVIQWRF